MSTRPFSAETLLAHEPFVRAVVRGLVRDEAELQDVMQETWLRGLAGAPSDGSLGDGSLRAWLARVARNLALDQRRGRARRASRERSAASGETVEGVASAYARLSTQREVVDAVLALEEPYRGVVLLRYFEGLEPTVLAERLGRGAGTVRSQLARAHALLRERLDRSCGREAWAGLALPLAWRGGGAGATGTGSTGTAAKLGLALALGVLGVVGVRHWLVGEGRASARESELASASPSAGAAAEELELAPVPVTPEEPRVAVESSAAVAPATPSRTQQPPGPEELAALSLDDRFALAVQLMRTIEEDLVRVDPALVARHADFLAGEGTGITRVLAGGKEDLVLSRGGCAYFSFATRRHSYNSEPDISFRDRYLSSGFYGGQLGLLYDAGPVPLASVPDGPQPVPGWVPEDRFHDWELLWSPLDPAKHEEASRTRMDRHVDPVNAGHVFLMRLQSPGEHDHLVAFSVLSRDDEGCTLLWRILATWPLTEPERGEWNYREEYRDVPAGPDWLAELSTEERIALLESLRAGADEVLFETPRESRDRFTKEVQGDVSFARLLDRNQWDPVCKRPSDACYYSFSGATNDYQGGAILELQKEFMSGFAGSDRGLFVDLGKPARGQLAEYWSGRLPAGLEPRLSDAWRFLSEVQPERDPSRRRAEFSEADATRAEELGLRENAKVVEGHVYLLRSVLFADRDELVIFQVLDRAHGGVSLAWKRLASWPVEGR